MPALKSPQQEKFAQHILKGETQSDAYRAAYPKSLKWKDESVHTMSSTLMANTKVSARVAELRSLALPKLIEEARYGIEQAMKEAKEAYDVSKEKENGGAMVAAVTLRAKLNNLLVDRKEIRTGALDDIPHEELSQLNAAIKQIHGVGADVITANAGSTRH